MAFWKKKSQKIEPMPVRFTERAEQGHIVSRMIMEERERGLKLQEEANREIADSQPYSNRSSRTTGKANDYSHVVACHSVRLGGNRRVLYCVRGSDVACHAQGTYATPAIPGSQSTGGVHLSVDVRSELRGRLAIASEARMDRAHSVVRAVYRFGFRCAAGVAALNLVAHESMAARRSCSQPKSTYSIGRSRIPLFNTPESQSSLTPEQRHERSHHPRRRLIEAQQNARHEIARTAAIMGRAQATGLWATDLLAAREGREEWHGQSNGG